VRHDTASKVFAQGKPLADFQVMTELEQGDLRLAAGGKGYEHQCYKTTVIVASKPTSSAARWQHVFTYTSYTYTFYPHSLQFSQVVHSVQN
jgi:hypothetical protein